MQRVSEIARQYLKEQSEEDHIEWDSLFHGDWMYLDEIFEKAGFKYKHLIHRERHQVVLNALDRESKREDAIFIKKYFRMNNKIRLVRLFILKKIWNTYPIAPNKK